MGLYLIDLSLNTCLILSGYNLAHGIKVQSLKYLLETCNNAFELVDIFKAKFCAMCLCVSMFSIHISTELFLGT